MAVPTPNAPGVTMYGLWNSILNWMFPPTSNYVTRPQDMHRFFGGQKGFSDFHTSEIIPASRRKFFLITQCKAVASESQEHEWQNASNQLRDYLSSVHGTRPTNQRSPVYGIAALGRRVRFFRYDDPNQNVVDWRPSKRNNPIKKKYYDIRAEAGDVQGALNWILTHH
ncbi:hypothetical protein UA08_03220 [Talaromyces atroroseus]|uniref:Uncharacterized protein n=1 Tax=Talaromyces atroroseus TaxID=1441469 RepID=A0A225AUC7_TALAT|nr:hypothetical protein UA08_03220 [Talaromyces atroroseus]OKL60898.1 hypothetical protein UA08_03220 [Talaromyces atroroseus]